MPTETESIAPGVETPAAGEASRKPRPKPVLAAAVLSLLFVALSIQILRDGISIPRFIPLAFTSLIAVGIWRGNRLAGQWAVLVGGVTGALLSVNALFASSGPWQFFIFAIVSAAVPISIAILLTLRISKEYFGVVCPSCQSTKTLPASFLYTKQRCRRCGRTF